MKPAHHWPDWRGVFGLRGLLDERHPGLPPANQAVDLGPKPVPECPTCEDWGHLNRDGVTDFCTCVAGQELLRKHPDWVDWANGRKREVQVLRQVPVERKITAEDIDKAFAVRQRDAQRMIAEAGAVLADDSTSRDRREIAREVMHVVGAAESS